MSRGDDFSPASQRAAPGSWGDVAARAPVRSPISLVRMSESSCLFCKIASGTIPADLVHADERLVAFRDIAPQAPVHLLVVPREHIASLEAASERHADMLGALLLVARKIAREQGLSERGYRTVINTGAEGGQTVQHLHLHLLGGRTMEWPPG